MSGAGADFAKLDFLQLVNKAFYVNEEKMLSRESEPEPKGVGADRKKTGSATLLNAIKLEIKYCIFYFISGQNNCFRKCLLCRISMLVVLSSKQKEKTRKTKTFMSRGGTRHL